MTLAPSAHCRHCLLLSIFCIALSACSATPGPDKSAAGSLLGAGWGTGVGAIIGNQVGNVSSGSFIGMGFGAANGLIHGIGMDISEGNELEEQQELDALRAQVEANQRVLLELRDTLDNRRLCEAWKTK